jgi:hypothetical protein
MKHFLIAFLVLISNLCYSQKYALIDKNMVTPISYTNTVTATHNHKNLFVVETDKVKQFISEIEKIAVMLTNSNKAMPETFEIMVGKTRFVGLKVPSTKEERLDVVLTTNCDGLKVFMHISDSKTSNARNAYFINTWIKYIRSYIK